MLQKQNNLPAIKATKQFKFPSMITKLINKGVTKMARKAKKTYMVRRGRKYLIERSADGTFGKFIQVIAPKKSKKAAKDASNENSERMVA